MDMLCSVLSHLLYALFDFIAKPPKDQALNPQNGDSVRNVLLK